MPRPRLMTVTAARNYARMYGVRISKPTIIKYIQEYELGHQIGGKGGQWAVHKERFRRFINGEDYRSKEKVKKIKKRKRHTKSKPEDFTRPETEAEKEETTNIDPITDHILTL